jgi:hypothetical protein
MASGHGECRTNRPDTWQYRPALQYRQKNLANRGPSTHGTLQTQILPPDYDRFSALTGSSFHEIRFLRFEVRFEGAERKGNQTA